MYFLCGCFSQELETVVSDDGLGDDDAGLNEKQFFERVRSLFVSHVSTQAHPPQQPRQLLRGLLLTEPLLREQLLRRSLLKGRYREGRC